MFESIENIVAVNGILSTKPLAIADRQLFFRINHGFALVIASALEDNNSIVPECSAALTIMSKPIKKISVD
jgi:hypothetical protein